jgi:hypothetical protein
VIYPVGTYLFERHIEDGRWAILRTTDHNEIKYHQPNLEVVVRGTIYPTDRRQTWTTSEFNYTEIAEEEVLIYKMASN